MKMNQTEIGLIPDDWEVKSLGEILTIKHGYGFEGDSFSAEDNGFIVVTPGNFKLNGGFQKPQASIFYIGKYPKEFNLKPNDLVIMMTDLSKESDTLGNPAIIPDDNYQYLHNQRIGLINCNSDNFDKNYLFHLLCSKDYHKAVVSTAAGSTVKHTSPKRIYTIKLPITQNLQEQQRIAKALSDVDALISTTEKLIQKKKNIKQGAMQNLLTGKKRLPGFGNKQTDLFVPNGTHTKEVKDVSPEQIRLSAKMKQTELGEIPEDWEVKSLGDIFSIKHGYGFEGQFFSSENNQHIVVTPRNFKLEGGFQKQKQPIYYTGTYPDDFKLKPNALIIMMTDLSKNSDTLGNPAIVPDDGNYYLHNQRIGLIQIHNDSFVKDYIYLLLCTKEYHEAVVSTAAGSTVKHTSPNRIYSINLVVSTSKEEQTAIANVLSSMDKEIETLNTKLEKYRNLKTAMMQQLLTGKIRLK